MTQATELFRLIKNAARDVLGAARALRLPLLVGLIVVLLANPARLHGLGIYLPDFISDFFGWLVYALFPLSAVVTFAALDTAPATRAAWIAALTTRAAKRLYAASLILLVVAALMVGLIQLAQAFPNEAIGLMLAMLLALATLAGVVILGVRGSMILALVYYRDAEARDLFDTELSPASIDALAPHVAWLASALVFLIIAMGVGARLALPAGIASLETGIDFLGALGGLVTHIVFFYLPVSFVLFTLWALQRRLLKFPAE